jgi:putative ABC transport system permease protein
VEGQAYSRDSDYPIAREGVITSGYFRTFQTKVLKGREFATMDRPGNLPVAVINDSFARSYFPQTDPLGRRIKKGRGDPKSQWLTIVGVVPDLIMQGMGNNNQSGAGYFIPIAQSDVTNFVSVALRTQGEPGSVTPEVRAAVASMDADLAVYDVLSMREVIARSSWFYTVFGTFFMAFGCSSLVLAVAGLYGVMSFAVTQRRREMGVRMALGAEGGQLVRLIMMKGVIRLSIGLLLGYGIGLAASNLLQNFLYRVNSRDPGVLAGVLLTLGAAGLAANFIPARRVSRIDPVVALSAE